MEYLWITTVILGLIILYLLYVLSNRNMNYWKIRGVPQVKTYPFVGNMLNLLKGKQTIVDVVTEMYQASEGEKYVGLMMFQKPVLLLRDINLINHILIKDFTYFQDRFAPLNENTDLFSAGMQNITGDRWRVLRHRLTPTFTSGKMKVMVPQIKECSDEAVSIIKERLGTDFDARNLALRFVLNVIGKIAFGINVDAFNEKTEKQNAFYQNSKDFFRPSTILQLKFLIFILLPKLNNFFGMKFVNDKVNNFFQKLTQDLIDYRRKNGVKRNDFLQLMLDQKAKEQSLLSTESTDYKDTQVNDTTYDAEEPEDIELLEHLKNVNYDKNATVFTNQIIVGQVFVFISGGSDTIASVLSFVLYELAMNKDVQTRLQEEIDTVLSTSDISYVSIRKMTYMEQVINEAIRLRSVGGFLSRICTEDYKLPGTDVTIEKDQFVYIPVQAIHKDPQYYSDPEKFDPDRFDDMDAMTKGIFFPFGGGPRICLAMRLAILEMKIFIATLLKSYNVVLSEKTQLPLQISKTSILLQVIGGLWVRFEPRA